ncbi:MAG: hypothetical protein IJ001_02155 [Oscillospiraceae bacterium]|nr:hypothetical protein [Oscillospiraceae bacterium]
MKKPVKIILVLLAVAVLAAVAALVWYQSTHVTVEGTHYAKDVESLDLRGTKLTVEEFDALREEMPECDILWNVPFQNTYYPSDTTTIVLKSLTEEDVQRLDYLPQLDRINAVGCHDYDLLLQLQERHPDCRVSYYVQIGESRFNETTEDLTIRGLDEEDAELLQYLPNAKTVHLSNPAASSETLMALSEMYPGISFTWDCELYGLTITPETTEVDLSGKTVTLEAVENALRSFPNVEQVIMCDCGIDNETMAAFREKMREEYKVVWSVDCGGIIVRTDETSFIPVKHNVYYFHNDDVYNLRYCEDMIAVDLGHMTFTDLEWVEYMPHLKYLILAHTTVTDISSLSTCKELVFLEMDWTAIRNYEPLLGCTALEDLNLGLTYGDYEVIGQMTWLKNLWWKGRGYKALNYLTEALPDTKLVFNSHLTVGSGWRNLQNYYDMRDALGMYYMEG